MLDIPLYYSFKTNEIRGDGIYIQHPEIRSLSISALNLFDLRFEEERFIQLNNPNFEVKTNLHSYLKHEYKLLFVIIFRMKYVLSITVFKSYLN